MRSYTRVFGLANLTSGVLATGCMQPTIDGSSSPSLDDALMGCGDPVVSPLRSKTGAALHFDPKDGCVAVSFDADAFTSSTDFARPASSDEVRARLRIAFDAWEAVSDTGLCFDEIYDSDEGPLGKTDRRIHIDQAMPPLRRTPTEVAMPTSQTQTRYGDDCLIWSATVSLDAYATLYPNDYLRLVGHALGLDNTAADSDSVMAKPATTHRSTLTAHDEAALQGIYSLDCRTF